MNYIKENSVLQPQRLMLLACGSFNPLTPMHLRMFEIAKDHFNMTGNYKVIGGIISPVHDSYGKKGLELAKHRCAMLKLALQSSDWIRLSDWESTQPQWSRTRLILQYHQNYINNFVNGANDINEMLPSWLPENIKNSKDNVTVKLLCGADLLESFAVPDLWNEEDIEDIVGQHGIVVVSRNGSNPEQFIFSSDILSRYQRNITTVTNWVPNEVSSTIIRTLLRRGQSVKYLMDDLVIEYIKKHGLYNIKTPAYNTTDSTAAENQNLFNENYLNTINSSQNVEEMDETDLLCRKDSIHVELIRPKMFCCGSSESTKTILNRPGQAVQIRGTVNTPNDHSKIRKQQLQENRLFRDKMNHPIDLEPVEHLWPVLKINILKKRPQTIMELKSALLICWEEITENIIGEMLFSRLNRHTRTETSFS